MDNSITGIVFNGFTLALSASLIVGVTWFVVWQRIRALEVARTPVAHMLSFFVGLLFAVTALLSSPGWAGGALAIMAILGAGTFLFSYYVSELPKSVSGLRPGERYRDFSLPSAEGAPFSLSSLDGRPILLKFYRGHW